MCINNNFLCQGSKTLLNFPQDKFKIETCVQEMKSCSVKVLKSYKTEVFAAKSFNFVMSKHRFTFSKGFSNQSTDHVSQQTQICQGCDLTLGLVVVCRGPSGPLNPGLLQLQLHVVELLLGRGTNGNIHVRHALAARPFRKTRRLWRENEHCPYNKSKVLIGLIFLINIIPEETKTIKQLVVIAYF